MSTPVTFAGFAVVNGRLEVVTTCEIAGVTIRVVQSSLGSVPMVLIPAPDVEILLLAQIRNYLTASAQCVDGVLAEKLGVKVQ